MTGSIHKLTSGDGYTYLTRQVARQDQTHGPGGGLDAYYSEKGESPGRWVGRGVARLPVVAGVAPLRVGDRVSEAQMKALFGEGRHPNADAITAAVIAARLDGPWATRGPKAGKPDPAAAAKAGLDATRLGRVFATSAPATAYSTACAQAFTAANVAAGRPWNQVLDDDERARVRTRVARDMFAGEHGRAPEQGELDRWIVAHASAPSPVVAGYDITFSPVKTVSALWAVAPIEVAERIEQAHRDAVESAVAWLEEAALYTREGAQGVRQVDVSGVVAAAFDHRDARSGDPDLHTHVAVANKVEASPGKWLAIDGRVVYKAMVTASETYNTRLEALLTDRLGVRFTERAQPDLRKRPVREVVGVPDQLAQAWSSRRAAITAEQTALTARFVTDHGRLPTPVEAIKLAQQATLSTRDAKHEPRSYADQRAQWRDQAGAVLGGDDAVAAAVSAALHPARTTAQDREAVVAAAFGDADVPDPGRRLGRWTPAHDDALAAAVLGTVAQGRARWQVWHVRAEAERRIRVLGAPADRVTGLVDAVIAAALTPALSVRVGTPDLVPEPAALRRRDGSSVYEVAGSPLYTSEQVLAAEAYLVSAAGRVDGRAVTDAQAGLALLETHANGVTLNPAQAQMVRDLATSGRRVQLVLAPAGSGKTTAMSVLSAAWADAGGTVIGLAPTAVAATGLAEEIAAPADTLAALTFALAEDTDLPDWTDGVDETTLAVIDEAGMAGTLDLAAATEWFLARGASVRLVGDDQQLAAIAAGGVLRDIATSHGAATLSQLVRFADPAEAAATLAVRDGDPVALGFYVDHGRVHVGDQATTADDAYAAWRADQQAGSDAVMLAPTRETVAALNLRAQADRLTGAGEPPGASAVLADGARAYVGDPVVTRRNSRSLQVTATDFVKNGDRWTVEAVEADGALRVRHLGHRRGFTLPAWYVTEHTDLGYAATVHGAQGITADTCHVIVHGQETRQLLYVAMTRGRHANHVYAAAAPTGTLHDLTRPTTDPPRSDLGLLTQILARDGQQVSATTETRQLATPTAQAGRAAARYRDAVTALAEQALGDTALAALDEAAEARLPGVTTAAAWPTLRGRVAVAAVDTGADPRRVLAEAVAEQPIGPDVDDPAAVLAARVPSPAGPGPLPWLSGIPAGMAAHPHWRDYLTALAAHLQQVTGRVHADAVGWSAATAPAWARPLLDAPDRLRGDIALWRAATGVPDTDPSLTGPPLRGVDATHQRGLRAAAAAALPGYATRRRVWADLAADLGADRAVADPTWPHLAERLDALARAGLPVTDLLTDAVNERPLPVDYPAAALWWRLHRRLAPAALNTPSDTLRPPWSQALTGRLGVGRAERVFTDPAWPSLVAAVHRSQAAGWTPQQIIDAALDAAHVDQTPADGGTATSDLAQALAWHVTALTTAPRQPGDQAPDEPYPGQEPAPEQDRDPGYDPGEDPGYGQEPPPDPAGWDEPPADLHLVDDNTDPYETPPDLPADADQPPVLEVPDPDEGWLLPTDADSVAALRAAEVDRFVTDILYPPTRPTPAPALTSSRERDRLAALNAAAAGFYAGQRPGSWVDYYTRQRLPGVDVDAGYAPTGWTTLTDHLRTTARATDAELLAAGLARTSRRGTLIDTFRDRLVIPLTDNDAAVVGFVARRNPTTTHEGEQAGPKYLNTPATALYDKSRHLYGLDRVTPGTIPVLVEGALDAQAVTAAGGGRYVGVAPLGTALTPAHVDQLLAATTTDTPVLVATDPDPAGRRAARTAYTALTVGGAHVDNVDLPDHVDPAEYARTHGLPALADRLQHASPLVQRLIADTAPATPWLEEQVHDARRAATLIAVLPSIPFHSIPFHSIPFHSIPFHSIPFHSIPFDDSIPFHSIPFSEEWEPTITTAADTLRLDTTTMRLLVADAAQDHAHALRVDRAASTPASVEPAAPSQAERAVDLLQRTRQLSEQHDLEQPLTADPARQPEDRRGPMPR